jgi:hypothetical protein
VKSSPEKKQARINPNFFLQWLEEKEMDRDKSHLTANEKMQPIQWTEQPTSALVVVGSFWP